LESDSFSSTDGPGQLCGPDDREEDKKPTAGDSFTHNDEWEDDYEARVPEENYSSLGSDGDLFKRIVR
jgi:hypothetical protein